MPKILTPWRAVSAMFILNGGLFGIWASRIPAIAERHHLEHGALGMLLLGMAAGAIISFPFAGKAADRFGAAFVTRWVALAYAASLGGLAIAPSAWSLAIALIVFGATHGAMDVAMNTWAGEAERKAGKPQMSSFHAMFSMGAGIGAASGYFAAKTGVQIEWHFVGGALGLLLLTQPFGWIDWEKSPTTNAHNEPSSLFTLPKGALLFVGIIAFCASLGEGAMADWSAVFLVTTTNVTDAQAALGYTVYSVAMVCTRLSGDRIIKVLGPVKSTRIAGICAASGIALAIISGQYELALLGFFLMGVGYAVVMPIAFSRAANDPSMNAGSAIASVSTLGYGGMLLGPPIIGMISSITSINIAFAGLAILALVIFGLANAVKQT